MCFTDLLVSFKPFSDTSFRKASDSLHHIIFKHAWTSSCAFFCWV